MQIRDRIINNNALIESFFSLSILNGLNVFLPLITLPYILRIVGVANYGAYAFVYVLIQYLLLINSYGFNFSATKQVAQNRDDKRKLDLIYNSVIACRLILLFVGTLILGILSPFLLDTESKKIMFLMGLGIVLGDTLNPVWFFQGLEKMRYMTIVNLISKTFFTISIFWFIRKSDDYIYIILINSLGFLISGLISTLIVKRQFKVQFFIPSVSDIKFQFKEGLALFGSSIGTSLYSNANIFILNFFVSDSAVGLYAAAEKIIKGLQTVTSPVTQALFPHIGKDFNGRTITYQLDKIWRISKILIFTLTMPNLLIFFGADLLVKLFCGSGYNESVLLVKIMSPVIIIGTLNYTLGVIGLINLNQQKTFFKGVMIAGISSILFLALTIPYWGIISASIAIPLSELILLFVCVRKLKIMKSQNND